MKTFTSTHHNAIWAVSGKALGSPLRQGLFQDLQPWLLGSCWEATQRPSASAYDAAIPPTEIDLSFEIDWKDDWKPMKAVIGLEWLEWII